MTVKNRYDIIQLKEQSNQIIGGKQMKRKIFIGILALILCLGLTGCEKKKKANNESNNVQETNETNNTTTNNTTNNTANNNTGKKKKIQKIEPDFYTLPTNVEMHVVVSNSEVDQEYYHIIKIGRSVLITEEVKQNGSVVSKGLDKYYSYYKYNGDDTWDYLYKQDKEWKTYKSNIDVQTIDSYLVRTPQLFEKHATLGDDQTKINIPDYGNVSVYVIKKGNEKFYYSDDLEFNLKYENQDTAITIEKFDTTISSFGIELPE